MSWLSSFFVAALSGVLGLFVAGLVTAACIEWFNVSSREGASGYLLVAMALVGGLAAFLLGLVLSRVVAAQPEPGFLKALGFSSGAVVALGVVAVGIAWLSADFAPKIDGRNLELAIEVRAPRDFSLPQKPDEYGAYAAVRLPGTRRYQPPGNLDLEHARQEDGRWIVTAVVPLYTSASRKVMDVRFSKDTDLTFGLPLASHPGRNDLEWSKWVESGWAVGTAEPPPEKKFNLRYKVQLRTPPPPAADPKDAVAAAFAALTPDAPLEAWLPFLFNEPNAERTQAVTKAINERQAELPALIRSDDPKVRERALTAATYPAAPIPEVVEAVLAEGRAIAAEIRRCNGLNPKEAEFIDALVPLRSRFNDWKHAWWTLHQRLGVDGRPPVREIHELALKGARGSAMDEIEVNARVILEQLDKMAPRKSP